MPSLSTQVNNASNVKLLITQSLNHIKNVIIMRMAANRRNASGRSVASLRVETTPTSGTLWGNRAFMVMERGRKGGKVPRGFVGIIAQWIVDKGISVSHHRGGSRQTQIRSVAYLMARKIRNSGTGLYINHTTQDIYSQAINREFGELTQKIMVQFGSFVSYINQDYANTRT